MLYLNKITSVVFLAVGHQICREFLIASIKHQKAWGSEDRVLQTAQQWEQIGQSFLYDIVSKTECPRFESLYPCHVASSNQGLPLVWGFFRYTKKRNRDFSPFRFSLFYVYQIFITSLLINLYYKIKKSHLDLTQNVILIICCVVYFDMDKVIIFTQSNWMFGKIMI